MKQERAFFTRRVGNVSEGLRPALSSLAAIRNFVLNKQPFVFDQSPMITRPILTITAAALLAAPFLRAQAPAPGAAPAAPAVPATPGTPATPPAAGATDPAKKAKPISTNEQRSLVQIFDAMQFHMRMGAIAKS